jgi:hypothetical protein
MGDSFYGLQLLATRGIGVLPPIVGSIEAWRALDAGRRITFVRPRPDIIAYHLGGSEYFSNVTEFEADLVAMQARDPEPGELRLLELRRVEQGRIPFGIFAPVSGWPLRDVIGFVRCELPLAAAIALQLYRGYEGAANVVTPEGELVREVLPHFGHIWRREVPSYIGTEPDISVLGRVQEARDIVASVAGRPVPELAGFDSEWVDSDADQAEAGAAFEAELASYANGVALGPSLARLLAGYGLSSPW